MQKISVFNNFLIAKQRFIWAMAIQIVKDNYNDYRIVFRALQDRVSMQSCNPRWRD